MKLAIAGDSAGEPLAKVLAEHLKGKHEVSEVSRKGDALDPFYANLSDRVARLLEIASTNCDRLTVLVNDLLDMDKIASGNMPMNFEPANLSSVVKQAVDMHRLLAELGERVAGQPTDGSMAGPQADEPKAGSRREKA